MLQKRYDLGKRTSVLHKELETGYVLVPKGENRYLAYTKTTYLENSRTNQVALAIHIVSDAVICRARASAVSLVFLGLTLLVPLYTLYRVLFTDVQPLLLVFSLLFPLLPLCSIAWQEKKALQRFSDVINSIPEK